VQRDEQDAPAWEEEVSAFSGNLPRLSRENNASRSSAASPPRRVVEEISPFSGNLPALTNTDDDDAFLTDDDEVSPFTGNLPTIRPRIPAREIESTLVPVSSASRRSQDQQAYREPSRGANRQRREVQEQQEPPRYTNGLWSYASKENSKKVEKRR
jgi:hypothetical protein